MKSKDKDKDENAEIEIKAILLGNSGVGKTNLINTSIGLPFNESENFTSNGGFVQKIINIKNKKYIINLFDTPGQENYESITKIFLKKSQIIIFVYDITDIKSFKDIEKCINISKGLVNNDCVCGILGNKNDLYTGQQVQKEEAQKYAALKKMKFQLVSAKEDPIYFDIFLKGLLEEFIMGPSPIETRETLILKDENKKRRKKSKYGCECLIF